MKALLVGDLHLTTQPRDEYRWGIFPRLEKQLKERPAEDLILLGDLTDAKDRHAAQLVNRITDEVSKLRRLVGEIHIVRGNHDGIDPGWPYFRFLGHLPHVHFYAGPAELSGHRSCLVLPHSRDPLKEWSKLDFRSYDTAFAHITVRGATSESGSELDSALGSDYFKKRNVAVLAGDVHVPQEVGPVCYVGAPYPLRFGDTFQPRLIMLDGEVRRKIPLKGWLQRYMLDVKDAEEMLEASVWAGGMGRGCSAGDQVKVRLHLSEERLHTWQKQRKTIATFCQKRRLDLVDVRLVREGGTRSVVQKIRARKPADTLQEYIAKQKLDERLAAVGRELL